MNRRWVVNASPIISLGRIRHLWVLDKLCGELFIPQSVADEVAAGPVGDPARIWIEGDGAAFVRPNARSDPRVSEAELGAGESSVLSLALSTSCVEVLLDDLEARRAAEKLGLKPKGTLAVLLLAKREGHIRDIAPLLRQLIDCGMRISDGLAMEILKLARENVG